jgi:hypothetical protein
MNATPIGEARKLLDLTTRAIVMAAKPSRLAVSGDLLAARHLIENIHRFVRTVDGDVHLSRVRDECQRAYREERGRNTARKVRLLRDLKAFHAKAQLAFPDLARLASDGSSDPFSVEEFSPQISAALRDPDNIDEGDPTDENAGCVHLADLLRVALSESLPAAGVDPADETLKRLLRELDQKVDELRHARNESFVLKRVHAAEQWAELVNVVEHTNPGLDSAAWLLMKHDRNHFGRYHRLILDPTAINDDDRRWFASHRSNYAAAAEAIRADFQGRLGSRASTAWLVQRYAKRCRWLRLAELREIAEKAGRERERALVRDAANYLFDQGLEVLTELAIGQVRYDVVGTALLIEGKVCSEDKSALRAVADGLTQLSGYAAALTAEGLALEPVLLVYRIGGRPVRLPPEHTIQGLRVSVCYVDAAPATESGSRGSVPSVVSSEAIDHELKRLVSARSRSEKGSGTQARRSHPARTTTARSSAKRAP